MEQQDRPSSPLPTLVTLLALLFSGDDDDSTVLPHSLLASSVLRRHHFLGTSRPSDPSYLQSTADEAQAGKVQAARRALCEEGIDDLVIGQPSFSSKIDEDGRLVASISVTGRRSNAALSVLLVWEEPQQQRQGRSDNDHTNDGHQQHSGLNGDETSDQQDEEMAGWRFYDLRQPDTSNTTWHSTVEGARTSSAHQPASSSGNQDRHQLYSDYTEVNGSRGEEDRGNASGSELGADDYWAGVSDSEDEEAREGSENATQRFGDGDASFAKSSNNDSAYWSGYSNQDDSMIGESDTPILSSNNIGLESDGRAGLYGGQQQQQQQEYVYERRILTSEEQHALDLKNRLESLANLSSPNLHGEPRYLASGSECGDDQSSQGRREDGDLSLVSLSEQEDEQWLERASRSQDSLVPTDLHSITRPRTDTIRPVKKASNVNGSGAHETLPVHSPPSRQIDPSHEQEAVRSAIRGVYSLYLSSAESRGIDERQAAESFLRIVEDCLQPHSR